MVPWEDGSATVVAITVFVEGASTEGDSMVTESSGGRVRSTSPRDC